MNKEYQKINIGSPPQSQNLLIEEEEVQPKEEVTKELELKEEPVEEPKTELEIDLDEKKEAKSETEDESKKKSPGRPKGSTNKKRDKRIQQLVEREKKAAARAEEAERRAQELEARLFDSTKQNNSSRQQSLETHLESLEKQLQMALDEDDTAQAVKIQKALTQAMMEHAAVSYELQNTPEYYEPRQQYQDQPKASEYAVDWVDEHPQFNNDVEFRNAALGVNAKLIGEGYDPDSAEFYEELDIRLSKRYPEFYDIDSENVVQSNSGNQNSRASSVDETENIEDTEDYPQTVAGASRTPSGSTSVKKGRKSKNTVILNESDLDVIEHWGIDPYQYAKRKKLEQEKDRGDYVPIFIPKDK
jgi:hypothetical protein